MADLIDRQAAIDALWKALHDYEDKTEKRFQESDDFDVADWIQHRIFVQNMSDIDRQTILNLPPVQPKRPTGNWEIYIISMIDGEGCRCSECGFEGAPYWDFCPNCGADMRGEEG